MIENLRLTVYEDGSPVYLQEDVSPQCYKCGGPTDYFSINVHVSKLSTLAMVQFSYECREHIEHGLTFKVAYNEHLNEFHCTGGRPDRQFSLCPNARIIDPSMEREYLMKGASL